jgi:hypothetical protein
LAALEDGQREILETLRALCDEARRSGAAGNAADGSSG